MASPPVQLTHLAGCGFAEDSAPIDLTVRQMHAQEPSGVEHITHQPSVRWTVDVEAIECQEPMAA